MRLRWITALAVTAALSTSLSQAEAGTIRRLYAQSKERNAIHASDSPENAAREVAFFFPARANR